ncbi:MAG TPA: pantoate--beta-alanine ligase [Stellaceae bacterium]|nr:pantoate--beta-alanine ligase [Stellaceae bacterium]
MSEPQRAMKSGLRVVRTVSALREVVDAWRAEGGGVALVPTMGALHRGHLALVTHARERARHVVASLFVNPAQFGPSEDFARYPRDEAADAAQLKAASCDLLYAPEIAEIYPPGFSVTVDPGPLALPLDGRFRPGHFKGVATVVAKLLLQARPDLACFGEKDYQQLQIIRALTRDLDIPVEIEGVPIVREPDGLALSSRNVYLSPAERAVAPGLNRALAEAVNRVRAGADPRDAERDAAASLIAAGFSKVDYIEFCDAASLAPLARLGRPARILGAAWLGATRLIDNLAA